MRKRIVVVGSSFAGLTCAIELKNKLGKDHDVVVLSQSEDFLFMPSLIWVPFGLRERKDITFPVRPVLESKHVQFHHTTVTALDPKRRQVQTSDGPHAYDYLVLATGPKLDYAAVPGMAANAQSIFDFDAAMRAREAFEDFVAFPGPVVVGAAPGASCFGAAYEFLFNFAHQLKKRDMLGHVPLYYVTAEPFLAHFGLGGFGNGTKMTEYFFDKLGIVPVVDAAIQRVDPGVLHLEGGKTIDFKYAMLAPAFLGVDAVRTAEEICTPRGFVKVDSTYRTYVYPEVFACGVAVQMDPPTPTRVPCGVPKTGYLSEEMAKVVAHNIAAELHGQRLIELPPGMIDAKCVLDAGNTGIIMSSDHFLEPREHAWLIPGPEAHWAKLAFEKYFLSTRRHGIV